MEKQRAHQHRATDRDRTNDSLHPIAKLLDACVGEPSQEVRACQNPQGSVLRRGVVQVKSDSHGLLQHSSWRLNMW
jgi:hypothetical protein